MEQMTLPMTFFPYAEYLSGFRRVRKPTPKGAPFRPWQQLELKLILRRVVKGGIAFTMRMMGREYRVPTPKEALKRLAHTFGRTQSLRRS